MLDLNDLRVFEKVAALRSFSDAARALGVPKSSVSRGVARLEAELGTRLFQRTTREVGLTASGTALKERCTDLLARLDETVDYLRGLDGAPRGQLTISAGIGFGLNILSELLPGFVERYPGLDVSLELSSRPADLVAGGIDVAIRMGPMPDSQLVARRLGSIQRYLCAAPAYLQRQGMPHSLQDIHTHDTVEMPGLGGRHRPWVFANGLGETVKIEIKPRLCVNDMLSIHRLVVNGAGLGCLSGYLCVPDLQAGRLVRLFSDWSLPPVEVSVVFPSRRELAPAVRAFVDFLREASQPEQLWQANALAEASHGAERRSPAAGHAAPAAPARS